MTMYIDNLSAEGLLQHKSWSTNVLSTTVSASTLTLTAASEAVQVFTGGTAGQILKLPDATTYAQVGQRYAIHNDSGQNLTINDNASALLILLASTQRAFLICTSVSSAAGVWSYFIVDKNATAINQLYVTYPGTGLSVNYTGGVSRANGVTVAVSAGTIALTASVTGGWIYVDIDGVVKQSASLPNGAMALSQFTTSGSAVTVMSDMREIIDDATVWGLVGDIVASTYNRAASAGVLERSARADHAHLNNSLLNRSGVVSSGTFAGSPKTATVTFTTALPSSTYSVQLVGVDARTWSYSSRTTAGFTISSNSNQVLTGDVSWVATITGEAS